MKKLRALFLTVASVLALALAAVGLAACDDKTEYYSLTLTYEATQGTVTATESKSDKGYEKDEEVTITVTAAENYTVGEVKVNDAAVELTEGKYTFKIAGNTTVTAAFTATTSSGSETPSTPSVTYYSVTLTAGQHGTASLSASDATEGYVAGEEVTLTVHADAGYGSKAKVNGTAVTLVSGEYTFEVEDNTTVAVEWVPVYNITVTKNVEAGGTVTLPAKGTEEGYEAGSDITVAIAAAANYKITKVTKDGADVTVDWNDNRNVTIDDLSANVAIAVEFTQIKDCEVTIGGISDSAQGTATLTPAATGNTYKTHTEVTLTVTPAADYKIDTVKVGGSSVTLTAGAGRSWTYTFYVLDDTEIEVTFTDSFFTGTMKGTWEDLANDSETFVIGDEQTITYLGNEYAVTQAASFEWTDSNATVAYTFTKDETKHTFWLEHGCVLVLAVGGDLYTNKDAVTSTATESHFFSCDEHAYTAADGKIPATFASFYGKKLLDGGDNLSHKNLVIDEEGTAMWGDNNFTVVWTDAEAFGAVSGGKMWYCADNGENGLTIRGIMSNDTYENALPKPITFFDEQIGTYTEKDGTRQVVIAKGADEKFTVTFKDSKAVEGVVLEAYELDDWQYVTIDEKQCRWWSPSDGIVMIQLEAGTWTYFLNDSLESPDGAPWQMRNNTWKSADEETIIVTGPGVITWNGSEVELIADDTAQSLLYVLYNDKVYSIYYASSRFDGQLDRVTVTDISDVNQRGVEFMKQEA